MNLNIKYIAGKVEAQGTSIFDTESQRVKSQGPHFKTQVDESVLRMHRINTLLLSDTRCETGVCRLLRTIQLLLYTRVYKYLNNCV